MLRVLGFKTEYKDNGKTEEWVHFTSSDAMTETGQATHSTWENVKRMIPPASIENDDGGLKMAAMRSTWAQIQPAYDAWKAGNTMPETGIPLGAWPAISAEQAAALKASGLRSVEDVASANEAILSRPPLPNMRDLKKQATMFIEARGRSELEAKIKALEEQNEAMLQMLTEATDDKPKRGRPRKEEVEAE